MEAQQRPHMGDDNTTITIMDVFLLNVQTNDLIMMITHCHMSGVLSVFPHYCAILAALAAITAQ